MLRYFIVPISVLLSLLLMIQWSEGVVELGKVKCLIFVNFSENFHDAHRSCWSKLEKEIKAEDEKRGKGKPYPVNATLEDFEWDDNCMDHCVYKTAGTIGDDDKLPDKSETTTLFVQGKVSDEYYKAITSAWDACLEISGKVGKAKGFDKCKTVTHHRHCFNQKMMEYMEAVEIEC